MQITTYQLEALETAGKQAKLKKKTSHNQGEAQPRDSGMHKTLQDRHTNNSSDLD